VDRVQRKMGLKDKVEICGITESIRGENCFGLGKAKGVD